MSDSVVVVLVTVGLDEMIDKRQLWVIDDLRCSLILHHDDIDVLKRLGTLLRCLVRRFCHGWRERRKREHNRCANTDPSLLNVHRILPYLIARSYAVIIRIGETHLGE